MNDYIRPLGWQKRFFSQEQHILVSNTNNISSCFSVRPQHCLFATGSWSDWLYFAKCEKVQSGRPRMLVGVVLLDAEMTCYPRFAKIVDRGPDDRHITVKPVCDNRVEHIISQRFISRAINQWRRRLECVVQQQGAHIEHSFWTSLSLCLTLMTS